MAEAQGWVNRILAPSFVDGPGSRMAIFMQGCDLRCAYCHNPETWALCGGCGRCLPECRTGALTRTEAGLTWLSERCQQCDRCLEACPEHASPRVRRLSSRQLLEQVQPWRPYLDGITFSGGECTLQWPFLLECLPPLRQSGLPVLLDSNGNLPVPVLEALLPVADGWMIDLKALDPDQHLALTGVDNRRILANLARIADCGRLTEVRSVLLPGLTDSPAQVRDLAHWVRDLGPEVPLRLSRFRPEGVRGAWATRPRLDSEIFHSLCQSARDILGHRLQVVE